MIALATVAAAFVAVYLTNFRQWVHRTDHPTRLERRS